MLFYIVKIYITQLSGFLLEMIIAGLVAFSGLFLFFPFAILLLGSDPSNWNRWFIYPFSAVISFAGAVFFRKAHVRLGGVTLSSLAASFSISALLVFIAIIISLPFLFKDEFTLFSAMMGLFSLHFIFFSVLIGFAVTSVFWLKDNMKIFFHLLFQLVCGVVGGISGGFLGILCLLGFFGFDGSAGIVQYFVFVPVLVMAGFAVWYAKKYSRVFSVNTAIFLLSLVAICGVIVFAFWELFNHFVLTALFYPIFLFGLIPAVVFVTIFSLWKRFRKI